MSNKTKTLISQFVGQHLSNLAVASTIPEAAAEDQQQQQRVATHDGKFHCDEALAVGLLRNTHRFKSCSIVRTRNPAIIEKCNAVLDVGGVYDPEKFLFDHHQKEFHGTLATDLRQYKTRLSSAGLVYKHFGREIIQSYADFCVKVDRLSKEVAENKGTIPAVYDALYKGFVEHIDGGDNGVEPFEGGSKNYSVSTTLPSRVGALFPRWNEPTSQDIENEAFIDAVHLTTTEFFEMLDFYLCAWWPGRAIVEDSFKQRFETHSSGRILLFKGVVPPWKDHLYDIERENDAAGQILYVIFPDGKGSSHRVMCVSEEDASFTNRKSLLWKGLRDADLDSASGIPGGVFVHVTGFIGGNKSFEGAMQMAIKSLEAQ
jgi:uncharacterized UPF0160 family protein